MNHLTDSWTGHVHTQAPASRLDGLWPAEPVEPGAGRHRFILSDPVFELLAEGTGSRHEALFRSLMEIGTERLLAVEFSERLILVSLSSRSAEDTPAPPTISEKLSTIRKAFGLSMAALAEVVQASRASLYNWLENEQPSPVKAERIDRLFRFAQEWEAKSPYHYPPGKLVRQRLGEQPSLFERLTSPDIAPKRKAKPR